MPGNRLEEAKKKLETLLGDMRELTPYLTYAWNNVIKYQNDPLRNYLYAQIIDKLWDRKARLLHITLSRQEVADFLAEEKNNLIAANGEGSYMLACNTCDEISQHIATAAAKIEDIDKQIQDFVPEIALRRNWGLFTDVTRPLPPIPEGDAELKIASEDEWQAFSPSFSSSGSE